MTPKISLVAVCCSATSFQFLEQPDVLDGDHCLVGKGFEQFDLLLRKRTDFGSPNHNRPNGNTFAK